ncbi:MAG TPA: hypothetical protein VGD15_20425 [Kribbella sp.]|jgi:hypothetical protein
MRRVLEPFIASTALSIRLVQTWLSSPVYASMGRLQRALEAGWDPEALTGQYNAAVAEKKTALAGLEAFEPAERLGASDIRAMATELGAMKRVLDQADRGDLANPVRRSTPASVL